MPTNTCIPYVVLLITLGLHLASHVLSTHMHWLIDDKQAGIMLMP